MCPAAPLSVQESKSVHFPMKKHSGREPNEEVHLFAFAPLGVWARLILENRGVARPYWSKLAQVLFASSVTLPFRVAETVLHSKRVARTEVREPPLFVLGYPRTGTTFLHNLLSKDPDFGYVTTFQAIAPKWFLIGRGKIKSLMQQGMGQKTRPVDNVQVSLDMPQEEEVALANSTHLSFIHNFSFPRKTREYFDRYLLLGDGSGLRPRELHRWEKEYMEIVRKATINWGGRRLVQKTPANQGRVPTLLRLFPDAKFVHIVRNPLVTYQSMVHMYKKILPLYQMHDFDWNEMQEFVMDSYVVTMKRFIEDSKTIPDGNLMEVKFEDLEADPLGELAKIYAGLSLPGWDAASVAVRDYLGTLAGYKKNKYASSQEVIDMVSEKWRFAFDHWDYSLPGEEPDS